MKLTRRILSLALAALLLCAIPVIAHPASVSATGKDVSMYPKIFLAGGFHQLFLNEGTEEEEIVFDSSNSLMRDTNGKEAIIEAVKALDFQKVGDEFVQLFSGAYSKVQMDSSGDSILPDITSDFMLGRDLNIAIPLPDRPWFTLGKNEAFWFFDWRLDPWDLAETLHTYIQEVKEETGAEKVNVMALSGSGPLTMCYLKRYGTEDLASLVFSITMHNGSSMFGNIATKNLGLNAANLGNSGPAKFMELDVSEYALLLRGLYEVGLLDILSALITLVGGGIIDRIYEEAIIPYWFQMPFYWSLVPHSQYEEAKQKLFQGDPKYGELVRKTDRYQYDVMARGDDILKKAASEIKLALICGYGFPLAPFAKGPYLNSDEVVDTALASQGATCAPPNHPFGPSYKQAVSGNKNYISPDRYVDASTCALPDQTWFVKGMYHGVLNRYEGWYDWFMETEGDYSVWGNPDYPQYLQFVEPAGVIRPETQPKTFLQAFQDILLSAVLWLAEKWRSFLLGSLGWLAAGNTIR